MGNVMPWGYKSVAKSSIDENERKRKLRFQEARARSTDINEQHRDEILALDFFQLKDALQADKYNARTVLSAYTFKALQVQDEINCVAEFLIEAFQKADEVDAKYSGKAEKPPLYGLPFSVKENFFIKDYDCNVGLAKFLNDPKKNDCTLIDFLQELGAIPFVLTNVPQALLSFVCSNSVYGTTGNPFDKSRIPGGSSGGEAALLAAKGSAFGTGSDLAGSLRIPAAMCGVVALKPTEARICLRHCVGGIPGKARMGLGIGYFTHTVDEHIFLLEQTLNSDSFHKTHPKNIPLAFQRSLLEKTLNNKSLRIGYFLDDGFLKATPGCRRVVEETVQKLSALGHEMVRFDLPRSFEAAEHCYKSIMTDGGTYLCKMYSRDIVDQYLSSFVTLINLPIFVRYLGSFMVGQFSPQARVLARAYVRSIEELRVNNEQVDTYTEEVFDLMNEQRLDSIICPAFTIPPVPHKYPSLLGACGFATAIWNMLDFPAGTIPVDSWTDEDDANLQDEKVWPVGSNFILKMMRQAAQNSKGLPLAVQVVSRPYQEEVCLGVMKIVENAWKLK